MKTLSITFPVSMTPDGVSLFALASRFVISFLVGRFPWASILKDGDRIGGCGRGEYGGANGQGRSSGSIVMKSGTVAAVLLESGEPGSLDDDRMGTKGGLRRLVTVGRSCCTEVTVGSGSGSGGRDKYEGNGWPRGMVFGSTAAGGGTTIEITFTGCCIRAEDGSEIAKGSAGSRFRIEESGFWFAGRIVAARGWITGVINAGSI